MILFNQLLLISCWIGYCFAQLDQTNIDCLNGPDFWCLNDTTESLCNFTDKTIGVCGYSTKKCPEETGDSFCKSSPPAQQQSPFEFDGGLTGVDDSLFSYYILSLYWPQSSCSSKYDETIDLLRYFCSPYTDINQPGSERLVLHGLWPTFSTKGNYQGWPQFCSSTNQDWSTCHINGNLCSWENTTNDNFTQIEYEYCLSVENVEECLINGTEILLPELERLKILAPGYLKERNIFFNHEWTKHGSCCSSIFEHNVSNYLTHMLDLADMVTQPGSLTYEYIQQHIGEKIDLNSLVTAFNQTAMITCNSKCELEEVWMCMDRDYNTGLPNQFIPCPMGARNISNSCERARCEDVFIPWRDPNKQIHPDSYNVSSTSATTSSAVSRKILLFESFSAIFLLCFLIENKICFILIMSCP